MERADHEVLCELLDNVTELRDHIEAVRKRFDDQVRQGWGQNPLFEKKLEIHRSLVNLRKMQSELSDGIIALLEELIHADIRPRMPIPPRPSYRLI